jgi:predicted phage terminase large subunit-like protein
MKLTVKQEQANELLGSAAQHILLYGGSRSGKTLLFVRAICFRSMAASRSRHAIFRFRFNAVMASIIADTFPKTMRLCYPDIPYDVDKREWVARFPNGSEIWFGGLDDKERTEKILGMEFATIFLNECSQIPKASRDIAVTRLAQKVMVDAKGLEPAELRRKMYLDENPPSKAHWTYKLFIEKRDPDTKIPLGDGQNYASLQINPTDNVENLGTDYMRTLEALPARFQKRFMRGEFADANPDALFDDATIDKWRVLDGSVPDLQRIIVGVDPSGSGDVDNVANDAIGIVVAGLGVDGNAYVLEDCTVKGGPRLWGNIAATAYDRHQADLVVGEANFGGAMVQHVIQTARAQGQAKIAYKAVTASRGKAVRAEPIAALYEAGKVRHVGYFRDLEDELAGFSTIGYTGTGSPNRADAAIWALSELFPGIVAERKEQKTKQLPPQRMIWAG